jgi:hypothetical protein
MGGTLCVATGLNFLPLDESKIHRILYRNRSLNYLDRLENECFPMWDIMLENRREFVKTLPSLCEYLKSKYEKSI